MGLFRKSTASSTSSKSGRTPAAASGSAQAANLASTTVSSSTASSSASSTANSHPRGLPSEGRSQADDDSDDEGDDVFTDAEAVQPTPSPPTKLPSSLINARSDSPTNISSDGEGSDSFKVAEGQTTQTEDTPSTGSRSRAATLAAEAMEAPIKERQRKGKPMSSLSSSDVKLTDEDIKEDISIIWKAMHLFMASRMKEAEAICLQGADHRLYYSLGYSLIQTITSLATFEPDDLEAAIETCKETIIIAQHLRKKDYSFYESSLRLAKGSTSVNVVKKMTLVQLHAELCFAECTLLKAVLGIIYSGDYIAFLKEALNMRNAYAIYRTLGKFLEGEDEAYGGEDPALDNDWRSGVYLGNGLISLILSLLPSSVLKVFGFTGDRDYALATLLKPGKWKTGNAEPGMPVEQEGIRRQIADLVLLLHHLLIPSYLPVGGVDVEMAANVLRYNLDRYPDGVFFLYFAGRLHTTQTDLDAANDSFRRAIKAQQEFTQLAHICYWDMGLVGLASGDHKESFECFDLLDRESNWSKSLYSYAKATAMYEQGDEESKVTKIMTQVPDLMQKIAGKSIPLEKFVARRAKKYLSQGNRLCMPGLELAYFLNCLGMAPRSTLLELHLDQVSTVISQIEGIKDPAAYGNGTGYWDDYCLAHMLRGIILHLIAFPEPHTKPKPAESPIPPMEAFEQGLISFNNVLQHAHNLEYDHHLLWFTHYEMGRLYEANNDYTTAKAHYDQVMSGKGLDLSSKKGKGKVTLQNMAVLRTNSALAVMRQEGKV